MVSKAPIKVTRTPLNIVDNMKRTNGNVPMWDVLTKPLEELLQQELKIIVVPRQSSTLDDATSFTQPNREGDLFLVDWRGEPHL